MYYTYAYIPLHVHVTVNTNILIIHIYIWVYTHTQHTHTHSRCWSDFTILSTDNVRSVWPRVCWFSLLQPLTTTWNRMFGSVCVSVSSWSISVLLGFDPIPVMHSTKCKTFTCKLTDGMSVPGVVGVEARGVGLLSCGTWSLWVIAKWVTTSWVVTCITYCHVPY